MKPTVDDLEHPKKTKSGHAMFLGWLPLVLLLAVIGAILFYYLAVIPAINDMRQGVLTRVGAYIYMTGFDDPELWTITKITDQAAVALGRRRMSAIPRNDEAKKSVGPAGLEPATNGL